MKRWLPQPLISVMLLVIWLALNNTLHPAHLVLGVLLAWLIPLWTTRLKFDTPGIKQPLTIVVLGVIVLIDIVKSNIDVRARGEY
jgi:multicomponent K+:H+ antiporter subunit E